MEAPGGAATAVVRISGLLAPNPGPMTLDGTQTWILDVPDLPGPLVVDPGPADDVHRLAAQAVLGERRPVALLLTHGHADHAAAAEPWSRLFGAPVLRPGVEQDGAWAARLDAAGVAVLATPGHTADSVCVVPPPLPDGTVAVLTGDTVLGRGSTVIAAPDGDLGAYLASLGLLGSLVARLGAQGHGVRLLPGHGDPREDVADWIAECLRHRLDRLEQVRAAVGAGARTAEDVVAHVYPGLDPRLRGAALQSAQAQLDHLRG